MAKKGLHVDKIQYVFTESTAPLFDTWASRPLGAETSLREVLDETVDVYILEGTGIRFSGRNVGEAIHGTSGADTLYGSGGKDAIFGSLGDDYIKGGRGGDLIFGDDGDDQIYGGPGADFLVGGAGSNTLFGGDGGDTAVYLGSLSDYNVSEVDGTTYVTSLADSTQQDALQNIEYLQFGYDVYRIEDALAGVSQENSGSTQTGSIQPVPEPDPTPDPAPEPDPLSADIILNSAFPVSYADAEAGASVLLDIGVILDGGTGSEDVRVVVSGLPDGVSLSAGENIGAGEWSLTFEELDGLTMNLPPMISDFAVAVTAALVTVGGLTTLASAETLMDTNADLLAMGSTTPTEPTDTSDTSDPVDTSGGDVVTGGTATSVQTDLSGQITMGTFLQANGPNEVVGLRFENNSTSSTGPDYVTFGHVFVEGDVKGGDQLDVLINGQVYNVQMNVKATYDDGSVKHAILTVETPAIAAGDSLDAMLVKGDGAPGAVITASDIVNSSYNFVADVTLYDSNGNPTLHSINAKDVLAAAIASGDVETWFAGSQASEYSVEVALDTHLKVKLDIRMTADGDIRTDYQMVTDSTYVGGFETLTYDVDIKVDNALVFSQDGIEHYRNANWHEQFWSGNEPEVFTAFDVNYMAATGAIPHYDMSLGVSGSAIQKMFDVGIIDSGPMGTAGIQTYMPTTGGRPDIGLLPTWTVQYLLSQNEDAFASMMLRADAAGSIPWHFVDESTGTYVSLLDRPDLAIDYRQTSGADALADPYVDIKAVTGWLPDRAHQPSLSYIPYLVSGDRYHLENQMAQTAYTIASIVDTDRNQPGGFLVLDREVYQQVRASAWTLRTLTESSFIAPDSEALKSYFQEVTDFSLQFMVEKYVVDGFFDAAGEIEGFFDDSHFANFGDQRTGLYMQDFLMSSLSLANERGFAEGQELAEWAGNFIAGRFINETNGYEQDYGAGYYVFPYNPDTGELADTWSEMFVNTYGVDAEPLDSSSGSPQSTSGNLAYAKMAVASLITATGSAEAVEAYGYLISESLDTKAFDPNNSKSYFANATFFGAPKMSDGSYLYVHQIHSGGSYNGGNGNELLYGSDLSDMINGNGGIDWIFGDAGSDTLRGGDGDDLIFGGAGSDTITGGKGSDYLKGNGGADTFVFVEGDNGDDTIADFDVNEDVLQISNSLLTEAGTNLNAVLASAYAQDDGIVLTLGDLSIYLDGLDLAHINQVDIVIGG